MATLNKDNRTLYWECCNRTHSYGPIEDFIFDAIITVLKIAPPEVILGAGAYAVKSRKLPSGNARYYNDRLVKSC